MKLEQGLHVKCLLKNNAVVEGCVEECNDQELKLLSLDGKSISVIHHPNEDILLTKIFLDVETEKDISSEGLGAVAEHLPSKPVTGLVERPDGTESEKQLQDMEKQFQENYELPSSNDVRLKNLAELRAEMGKQERKIIAEKLKNHHIDGTRKVEYGYPGFLKKPSTK